MKTVNSFNATFRTVIFQRAGLPIANLQTAI